jgi:hypothetical protein
MQASEEQAEKAIAILERAITAARNGNQAGENAVVKAAAALLDRHPAKVEVSTHAN